MVDSARIHGPLNRCGQEGRGGPGERKSGSQQDLNAGGACGHVCSPAARRGQQDRSRGLTQSRTPPAVRNAVGRLYDCIPCTRSHSFPCHGPIMCKSVKTNTG